MTELPSGSVVQIRSPGPPSLSLPTPAVSAVVVMPTPGIPGLAELSPEQLDDLADEIIEDLSPETDLVVLFENNLF